MAWSQLLVSCVIAILVYEAQAAVVEHTFHVGNMTIRRLCEDNVITAANGRLPGPVIRAHEGDTIVVHVINESPYNMTIHWHGVFQKLSAWADGPSYITQCPIIPGESYTYKFTVAGQEGTLWWHAHVSALRATVYGALIIKPRAGVEAYPFPKPYKEVPIILGEWWKANAVDVDREAYEAGAPPNISDAFTINGKPGRLYPCPKHTYKLKVVAGKTYLLRIINAALDSQLFFKIAGHKFKVVGVDATYTNPYPTDVIVVAPGQTVDALMTADAPPSHYFMAASAYHFIGGSIVAPFDNTTATALLHYEKSHIKHKQKPLLPIMPPFNDTYTATRFYTSLTSLVRPGRALVPMHVDERMFVTIGANLAACQADQPKCRNFAVAASMNNESFKFPTKISLLEAQHKGTVGGVYTADFPDRPPVRFDYTNPAVNNDMPMIFAPKSTKVKRVRYNATVEMALQNTAIIGIESHPMHLHGFNFFVLAQGFGNYDEGRDWRKFNLWNPQERNTIAVPPGGWAVIRFRADNPGQWLMHCHLDLHLSWGLAMVFQVDNGPDPSSTLPPPPADYPKCY